MTVYQKIDGVWTPATMIYVNRGGVQTPAANAYVKRSGVWTSAYIYDVVPPPAPIIEAQLVERFSGGKLIARWYNVGVRAPGSANDTNIRRIRVLTTFDNAYPTSQYGGTYTAGASSNYPDEPWSEWRYNGFGSHGDTSVISQKAWPRNPASTYTIPEGKDYHFSAWTEDFAGNWSNVTSIKVTSPKNSIDNANVIAKSGRFQITESGSATTGAYTPGKLVQRWSPYSEGLYFYGNQIQDTIGEQGSPTIKSAQIYIQRLNDGGSPTANVYIARHTYANSGLLPSSGREYHTPEKLGTIAKGEGKWFPLPESYYPFLRGSGDNGVKGIKLSNKDFTKASAFADDFSEMAGIGENLRAGEMYVSWTEAF